MSVMDGVIQKHHTTPLLANGMEETVVNVPAKKVD